MRLEDILLLERQILYYLTYMWNLKPNKITQFIEAESRMVVTRTWGLGRRNGEELVKGTKLHLNRIKV